MNVARARERASGNYRRCRPEKRKQHCARTNTEGSSPRIQLDIIQIIYQHLRIRRMIDGNNENQRGRGSDGENEKANEIEIICTRAE